MQEGAFYQVIKDIPVQENTWYWGWSTGYVQIFNNQGGNISHLCEQSKSDNTIPIQKHGQSGLAFKTPKGAYSITIYAAPTASISQVRVVMGKSKVDVCSYGKRVYKDPYFFNPYWFDMISDNYWVNQVSADGFTGNYDGTFFYQDWIPIVGKTYIGNSGGYQAECYAIDRTLIHRFEEKDRVFTIPEGTAYCRTYCINTQFTTRMIIPGDTLPDTYVPYGERVPKAKDDVTAYYLRRSSSPLPRAVNMLNFKIEDCYGNKTWSKKDCKIHRAT